MFSEGEVDAIPLKALHQNSVISELQGDFIEFTKTGLYTQVAILLASDDIIVARPGCIEKIIRALRKAEIFLYRYPDEVILLMANRLEIEEKVLADFWKEYDFGISFSQALLTTLDEEARWFAKCNGWPFEIIPNFLGYIYYESMEKVDPACVTVIR